MDGRTRYVLYLCLRIYSPILKDKIVWMVVLYTYVCKIASVSDRLGARKRKNSRHKYVGIVFWVFRLTFRGDLMQEVSTPNLGPKIGRREALHDTSVALQAVLSILGLRDFFRVCLGAFSYGFLAPFGEASRVFDFSRCLSTSGR